MKIANTQIEKDYTKSINKALLFIDDNLDSNLSLEIVSGIANFSPYHFHRLFKAIISETLNSYVIRKRIEKAASILMYKKDVRITELSLQYGFQSNSSFTRAFKKFYGISPSEFKRMSVSKLSKICKVESKKGQEKVIFEKYLCNINNLKNWIKMNAKIEVQETPELYAAYVTHVGIVGIEKAFDRLLKWAKPKGLLENPNTKMARVFHDSFKITAPDKVRMSICMLLENL